MIRTSTDYAQTLGKPTKVVTSVQKLLLLVLGLCAPTMSDLGEVLQDQCSLLRRVPLPQRRRLLPLRVALYRVYLITREP